MSPSPSDAVEYLHAPEYRLFSPLEAVLATFLGTPLAGSLVLAWNYVLVQRTASAIIAVTIGFWGTVCVWASFGADRGVQMAAIVVPVAVATLAAQLLQARIWRDHEQRGGQMIPYWRAAALGAACSSVMLGGYLAVAYTPLGDAAFATGGLRKPTPKLTFGPGEEVIYSDGATEPDARKLGRFLQKIGIFDGKKPVTVRLVRRGETLVVGCVVREDSWDNPDLVGPFSVIKEGLKREAFPGQSVEIQLLDANLNHRKTIE